MSIRTGVVALALSSGALATACGGGSNGTISEPPGGMASAIEAFRAEPANVAAERDCYRAVLPHRDEIMKGAEPGVSTKDLLISIKAEAGYRPGDAAYLACTDGASNAETDIRLGRA